MKELYFVSPYSRSMRTIHFQYGYAGKNDYAGKKYILKITSGEINGKGTSEVNTEEGVNERKKELLDTNRLEITEKQSTTQPSFIQNDLINGKITNDTWWEK